MVTWKEFLDVFYALEMQQIKIKKQMGTCVNEKGFILYMMSMSDFGYIGQNLMKLLMKYRIALIDIILLNLYMTQIWNNCDKLIWNNIETRPNVAKFIYDSKLE